MSEKDRRITYARSRSADHRSAEHGTDERDWFADEVAIDFPSVDRILGRMREAFFGLEHGTLPLSTEVLLTASEAFRGVKIPLDVPVRHTCPICGGRGEVWMEPCTFCAGTGEGLCCHPVQVSVPPGVRHGTRLRVHVTPSYAPSTLVEVRIAIQ